MKPKTQGGNSSSSSSVALAAPSRPGDEPTSDDFSNTVEIDNLEDSKRRRFVLPDEILGPLADLSIMRARLGWLLSQIRRGVGLPKMIGIAAADIIGSLAVTAFAYGILFVLRTVAASGPIDLIVYTVDPTSRSQVIGVVVSVFIVGSVGSAIRYMAERAASRAAIKMAKNLRTETLKSVRSTESQGWHSMLDGRLEAEHFQLVVGAIREVSVAARYGVGLAGPIGVGLVSLGVVFYLQPVITLMMIPFAVLNFAPILLVGKSLDGLNKQIDVGGTRLREVTAASALAAVDQDNSEADEIAIASADEQDQLFHDRLLQPIRLQTLGVVSSAALTVIAFIFFILRVPEVSDLNIRAIFTYAISMRFLVRSIREMSTTAAHVSRRALAIDRYRQFHVDLEGFQERRRKRHVYTSQPSSVTLVAADESSTTVVAGETTLLLLKGKPSRVAIEKALLVLEDSAIVGGSPIDLVGDTEFEIRLGDVVEREDYVVRNAPSLDRRVSVKVVVTDEPLLATMSNDARFQFIASNLVQTLLNRKLLDEWDHLFAGVLVVVDDVLVTCGDMDWARENVSTIREALKNSAV